jgi:tetratricopeptide (TPR) repeat protein
MGKSIVLSAFLALPGLARATDVVQVPPLTLVDQREQIIKDAETRIQKDILDPLFGKDRAAVFVDVEIEMRAQRRESLREGAGIAEKYKEKGEKGQAVFGDWALPGVPKPKNISNLSDKGKPEAAVGQAAQQSKTEQEEFYAQELVMKKFQTTVFHDEKAPAAKLKEIRGLIVDAMARYKIKPEDVFFKPMKYQFKEHDWRDDFKEPRVYLPLLYATLLLLLLLFLFGPFARFLRRYVEALVQKPAAEINVESNIEPPEEEEGGGGGGSGAEEGLLDILVGNKPPELPPPPPPDDEEDDMAKKMEPFAYINETNLKRLANLFQIRREEPWLIAVVLSYLRPEYARQVLTALPLELQAKVAMEALTVRQVTREQVAAIDAEIKENVEFVVGGIERLTQMLEEADGQTRTNILEYLKNDKPAVYDHVRRLILLFEDIAGFPDRDMQVVVRELKTESMARALTGAAPEVVNKFFSNMSSGAASLLKESMEYTQGVSPQQIEEERAKIMDQIKALDRQGKIAVRSGKDEGGFQQVIAPLARAAAARRDEKEGAGPAAPSIEDAVRARIDPEEAKRYFDAGVASHEAGNTDEAVKYFQQAIEFDPDLWQAYQYLGSDLFQMGRASEALLYYEKSLAHNPDPQLQAWVDDYKAQNKPA